MDAANEIVALRQTVSLLCGEAAPSGWMAHRLGAREPLAGLFLLSSWRAMFVDTARRFSAMPIASVQQVELVSPTQVRISTWYDRLHLAFDSLGTREAVLTLLRRNPKFSAVEVDLGGVSGEFRRAQALIGDAHLTPALADDREILTAG